MKPCMGHGFCANHCVSVSFESMVKKPWMVFGFMVVWVELFG